MKIAVLDWATVTADGDISPDCLSELGEVSIYPLTSPDETIEHIGDADVVLCNKVLITREVMDNCPNLRYVGLFATGFNNVDIEYAAKKGIAVCNAGQYSTDAVAQQTFAYILDYFSRVRDYDRLVKEGKWENSPTFSYFPLKISELAGKTLSVVGFGSIGRRVAQLGAAFGMNVVVAVRRTPENCPYEITDIPTAAAKADVLTFHCPLTEQTKGVISRELLGTMKSSAVLINTARGGIADESAVAEALEKGEIAAYYADVLEKEPMSPSTPLKNAPNCVITPHTAWAAQETRHRLMGIVCGCVKAWMQGSPVNKVN